MLLQSLLFSHSVVLSQAYFSFEFYLALFLFEIIYDRLSKSFIAHEVLTFIEPVICIGCRE